MSELFLLREGVRLRTQLRTRAWTWLQVERFDLDEAGLWTRLVDGRRHGLVSGPLNLGVEDPRDPTKVLPRQHPELNQQRRALIEFNPAR